MVHSELVAAVEQVNCSGERPEVLKIRSHYIVSFQLLTFPQLVTVLDTCSMELQSLRIFLLQK